ncbi:amidohydrolase family protein [Cellulomonas sp. URHD0024]|uniref:N-acyl-D-amino-acid deacylase family protein n=1 Tax=Cellulomonas sp. URHD0024 TaxID=1302620 RepID=UPI00042427E8|nr:amidohydrolase family protein [Cellulomonas sp. URHD0024]
MNGKTARPVLVRGGLLADGVHDDLVRADIRVLGDRIVEIGPDLAVDDDDVISAGWQLVMPGFIDTHVHVDSLALDPDAQAAMTHQGITTVLLGQDGVSFAPSPAGTGATEYAERYFAAINGSHPTFRGGTVRELLATYDGRTTVNTAYLVPHGTLRFAVMGADDRPASPTEVASMVRLLEQGLDDGGVGMSTGLEYAPATSADRDELVALLSVLAARGKPHVSHMRGYDDHAPTALTELLDLARATGVGTHVSHLHGPADVLRPMVDDALAAGLDLTFDSYPYLKGSSILALVALPSWLPLADPDRTLAMLRDPSVRAQLPPRDDVWPRVTLSWAPGFEWAEGQPLLAVAAQLAMSPTDAAHHLLIETKLQVGCVFGFPPGATEHSMRALAQHPVHCAGSDGLYLGRSPHPRGWGTFARYLGEHTRELADWGWPEAAAHLSTTAARRFGFTDRGTLTVGGRADIVLFEPSTVIDTATYAEPRSLATGVQAVLVNGVPVLREGALTGALPGRPS